jgi:hypothetical protein
MLNKNSLRAAILATVLLTLVCVVAASFSAAQQSPAQSQPSTEQNSPADVDAATPEFSDTIPQDNVEKEPLTKLNADLPSKRYGISSTAWIQSEPEAGYVLNAPTPEELRADEPNQVGVVRQITPITLAQGKVFLNSDGSKIRLFTIKSPGAAGVRLHFTDFDLPEGDEIYIYGLQKDSRVYGPYTGQGLFADKEFWSAIVEATDTVVIEHYAGGADSGSFKVPELGHFFDQPEGKEGMFQLQPQAGPSTVNCHLDASCQTHYGNALNRAVGRIVYRSSWLGFSRCTGTLLDSTPSDGSPLFLTANHCIDSDTKARTASIYWFYQTSSCNSSSLRSWRQTVGAKLLANQRSTDQSLLRVSGSPPAGVSYARWSTSTIGRSVFGLHHPGGASPPQLESALKYSAGYIVNHANFSCSDTGLQIGVVAQWEGGLTEPGSSGSGLFQYRNGINYLIGVLSCDNTQAVGCAGANGSWYGLFRDFYFQVPAARTYLNRVLGNTAFVTHTVVGQEFWNYRISVPSGTRSLEISTSHLAGNADLYLNSGTYASPLYWRCRSIGATSKESCRITNPTPGDWYIRLQGNASGESAYNLVAFIQ